MKRLTQIGVLLIAAIFIFNYSGQAKTPGDNPSAKSGKNFTAHLSGGEVVPAVETKATGQATFKLSADGTTLNYKLIVANIDSVLATHIHLAPAGQNGPVVAPLFTGPPAPKPNGVLAEGSITAADVVGPIAGDFNALMDALNNGNAYVNVHTAAHGGGEIRGQIK